MRTNKLLARADRVIELEINDGSYWPFAVFAAPQKFVAYWTTNNGQRAVRCLNC